MKTRRRPRSSGQRVQFDFGNVCFLRLCTAVHNVFASTRSEVRQHRAFASTNKAAASSATKNNCTAGQWSFFQIRSVNSTRPLGSGTSSPGLAGFPFRGHVHRLIQFFKGARSYSEEVRRVVVVLTISGPYRIGSAILVQTS